MKMIKALIAFDAKINRVNNSCFTPLDIALDKHSESDLRDLLVQLGAMTSEEMGISVDHDSYGSGRVSPYTEIDMVTRNLKETDVFKFHPIFLENDHSPKGYHEEINGDSEPLSPSNQPIMQGALLQTGALTSLTEGQLLSII